MLSARERRGSDLVITLKDGQTVTGELIAVKQDSLLLLNSVGKDESVDIAGIGSIRIVMKSRGGTGFLIGFFAGAIVGGVAGYIVGSGSVEYNQAEEGQKVALAVGGLSAAAGGLIGLGIGAAAGKDKTIQLEGISEPDRAIALDGLRRKARITDF